MHRRLVRGLGKVVIDLLSAFIARVTHFCILTFGHCEHEHNKRSQANQADNQRQVAALLGQ